jgi:CHAD domain-containing protein
MFQIEKGEGSGEAIKRIIWEEVEAAIALLTDPDMDIDTAVHETRKGMKRIRAALRLVRGEIGEIVFEYENEIYRDAARHLAILRDSAVMVETLESFRNQDEAIDTAVPFQVVYEKLVGIKEVARQKFLEQKDTIPNIVARLTEARERVETLPINRQDFGAYQNGLRRVYRRGRKRMNLAYEDGNSPEKFHDWRKRVKYLWHHIEILQPLWPPVFEVTANELHQLSDYLGEAHDAAVLVNYIAENETQFEGEPELPLLISRLNHKRQGLETAAQPLGLRLFAETPRQFVNRLSIYWQAFQM